MRPFGKAELPIHWPKRRLARPPVPTGLPQATTGRVC